MKLQGKVASEYKGKEYFKNWIVIPNKLINELGWENGENLKGEIKDGKLIIEKE